MLIIYRWTPKQAANEPKCSRVGCGGGEAVWLLLFKKKLKSIGRYLATYVALLGVETWDPFRGVPNWTLICINVGVKWGVCIGVVVVSSKINI